MSIRSLRQWAIWRRGQSAASSAASSRTGVCQPAGAWFQVKRLPCRRAAARSWRGIDGEAVRVVGGALERGDVDPGGAPQVVDDHDERLLLGAGGLDDSPEPFGGLGDDACGVGLVVAHEHELVGAGERGAGGRVVEAGAAVQDECSDQL